MKLADILKKVIEETKKSESFDTTKVPKEVINDPNFKKLVSALKASPQDTKKLEKELQEVIQEDSQYYDFGGDSPKEISTKEYWARKLKAIGLTAAAGALLAIPMAGGTHAQDILQMALGMATAGGALGGTVFSGEIGKMPNEEP